MFLEHNRPVHTAESGQRRDVAIYQPGSLVPMISSIPAPPIPVPGGQPPRPQTQGRAPCWRKSKQEKVDAKIEKMLEAYKVINELEARRASGEGPAEARRRLAKKYFPEDEDQEEEYAPVPEVYMDSDQDALEDIIKNDDSESDGTHQI